MFFNYQEIASLDKRSYPCLTGWVDERRVALRNYLNHLVHDLAMRGVIRRKQGQSLDEILGAEGNTVFRELKADLAAVGIEMLGAGAQILGNFLSGMISGVGKR